MLKNVRKEPISLEELARLYSEESWPVAKIAKHVGVTPQALYERLRKTGVVLDKKNRTNSLKQLVDRDKLIDLYQDRKLSIDETARQLNATFGRVSRSLRAYNIKVRPRGAHMRKYPILSSMKIGESFTIRFSEETQPTFAHQLREAKRLGVRVVTRKLNKNTAVIIRTELLTPETVLKMFKSGMTRTAIAAQFRCSRQTVSKFMSGMGVSKRER